METQQIILVVIIGAVFVAFGIPTVTFIKEHLPGFGETCRNLEEIKDIVADYKANEQWTDIIEELIAVKEECPEEEDKVIYLEEEGYDAYLTAFNIYGDLVDQASLTPGDDPLSVQEFCVNSVRYYEKFKEGILDQHIETNAPSSLQEFKTKLNHVAQSCYVTLGISYSDFALFKRTNPSYPDKRCIELVSQDSKDLCERNAVKQAKEYFEKAKAVNYDRTLTDFATSQLVSLTV